MTALPFQKHARDSSCSTHVRSEDARAIVRLAGEIRELSRAHQETTPHLLREFGRITRSDIAVEFTACIRATGSYHVPRVVDHGWRSQSDLLLTGAPEKHVADLLGVSRNTAHQYVKSIYRKLSVTSRPQLMAEAASLSKVARSA